MAMFQITIEGETKEYGEAVRLSELLEERNGSGSGVLLATVNGHLRELWKTVREDAKVEFVTLRHPAGRKSYERALLFVLIKAVHDCFHHDEVEGVTVEYSIGNGLYCELHGPAIVEDEPIPEEYVARIKARMEELVRADLKFEKRSVHTDEAIRCFRKNYLKDKERLFRYRRVSQTNIYELDGYVDYFYGYMPSSTGVLKSYDLLAYSEGLMLVMPDEGAKGGADNTAGKFRENAGSAITHPGWEPREKLFYTLHRSSDWGRMMGIHDVGALNGAISHGEMQHLILVQEALQEKRIAEIAEKIAGQPDKRMVMIAGPSSSGKTTFSHRLSVQLRTLGLNPHAIAVDDYFLNREDTPKDADGNYNFECLEALDTARFNKDMQDLLRGEEVELPAFNFKTGLREYRGNVKKLGKEDILVIEGIHGLNDKLSYSLPRENKFKIYISALTQLNIDEHNRIPTTDGRLLRRMVRDARNRGTLAKDTIAMWGSVRRGEEQNIFPFQEEADVMFNSALIYELAVLKTFAEPILFGIEKDEPEYMEAKRLLKFLDYFIGVSTDEIPKNSIIREFIGGSCFHV